MVKKLILMLSEMQSYRRILSKGLTTDICLTKILLDAGLRIDNKETPPSSLVNTLKQTFITELKAPSIISLFYFLFLLGKRNVIYVPLDLFHDCVTYR